MWIVYWKTTAMPDWRIIDVVFSEKEAGKYEEYSDGEAWYYVRKIWGCTPSSQERKVTMEV